MPLYFWILTTPLACPYWQARPGLDALLHKAREEARQAEERWLRERKPPPPLPPKP